jgi:hypothetical protein
VKDLLPAADRIWVRKTMTKGRELGTEVSVRKKYAELDLMKRLPFVYLHKVVLAEQIVRGSEDVVICMGMSTQGSGSGLHVAYEMSRKEGALYKCPSYLDDQKVTDGNEVLIRLSTYSPLERRMLTVAECIVASESL